MTPNFIALLHLSRISIYCRKIYNVMDWGNMWPTKFNLHKFKCEVLSFDIQVNIKKMMYW